jgi:hypothetical protein
MNKTRIIRAVVLVAGIYFVLLFMVEKIHGGVDEEVFKPITKVYSNVIRVIGIFAVGLGITNIFMVHTHRIVRLRQNWEYSIVLLASFFIVFSAAILSWFGATRVGEFAGVFEYIITKILVHMNSTIYSFLAFFVASSALRAFRVHGLESAVMMAAAVVVLAACAPETAAIPFVSDLREWIDAYVNAAVFRALQFGMLLGMITVALRTWLGIERSALFEVQ